MYAIYYGKAGDLYLSRKNFNSKKAASEFRHNFLARNPYGTVHTYYAAEADHIEMSAHAQEDPDPFWNHPAYKLEADN